MARRSINIGMTPGSLTLDGLRSALTKTEQNFSEVYTNVDGLTTNVSNLTSSVTTNANRIDQLSSTVSGLGNLSGKANLSGATFTGGVTFSAGLAFSNGSGIALGQGGSLLDETVSGASRTRISASGDNLVVRNAANSLNLLSVNNATLTYKTYTVWHSGNFTPDTTVTPSGASFSGPVQATTLTSNGNTPSLTLKRASQNDTVADQNTWDIVADNQFLRHRLTNDAATGSTDWLTVKRIGMTISAISMPVRPSFGGATPWDSANFSPSTYLALSGGTLSGGLILKGTTGGLTATSSNLATLAVRSGGNTTDAAYLSFSRGSYGLYLGLDTDNDLKIGGWSLGNVARRLWHEGNLDPSTKANVASPNVTTKLTIQGVLPSASASITLQPSTAGAAQIDFLHPGSNSYDWRIALAPDSDALTFTRPSASAALSAGGLLTLTGASNGLFVTNRDTNTSGWALSSTAAGFSFNNGADRVVINPAGDLTATTLISTGGLNVSGTTNLRPKSGDTTTSVRLYDANGTLNWTITNDASGNLAFKQGASSTAAVTLRADQTVQYAQPPVLSRPGVDQAGVSNVLAAGADPSGVTDSTNAIQHALDVLAAVGGGILWIPPGTYRVTQTLTFIGTGTLKIMGVPGSSLLRQETATLFSLQASAIVLDGFSLLCAMQAATAFDFTVSLPTLTARDLTGKTIDDSSWWDFFFKTSNLSNSLFENISVANAVSTGQSNLTYVRGAFVNASGGSSGASNNRYIGVTTRAFYYGFYFNSTAGAIHHQTFSNCEIMQSRIGVSINNSSSTSMHALSWNGGTIEAFESCISVANDTGSSVRDAALIRDCTFGLPGQHVRFDNITGNGMISNCIMNYANSSSGKTMGAVPSITINACTGIIVSNNVGLYTSDVTAMVLLSGGSTICNAVMNIMRGGSSATTDGVQDLGSANYSYGNRRV
jgi:hypothetical protein